MNYNELKNRFKWIKIYKKKEFKWIQRNSKGIEINFLKNFKKNFKKNLKNEIKWI